MAKYHHRICLSVPFEMYDILQGELLLDDKAAVIASIRKYLTLFCMVSSPGDMEVLSVEKNWNMATHNIYVCSKAFPKVSDGCMCISYNMAERDTIKQFFQGLDYYE
jgi:hypothetical protein